MADDCVCTALTSLYTMQSDLFTQMVSRLNNIGANINSINTRLQTIVSLLRYEENGEYIGLAKEINNMKGSVDNITVSLNTINSKFKYNDKSIAEIWSLKEMCVSNETIVESPLSTFVSKAKLDVDE